MKTKAVPILKLVGKIKGEKKITTVPNLLVIRKGMEKSALHSYLSKNKIKRKNVRFFAFVSSPYIYLNNLVRSIADLWLHPFRKPEKYLPPKSKWYFMSESDFVDIADYPSYPDRKDLIWDYFYFTLGGDDGVQHKGYKLFRSVLPALSHLKGTVIVYGKPNKFSNKDKRYLRKQGVKVFMKKFTPSGMQGIYGRSRFGLFPSITDCSPRTIPECMIHNTPILVNKKILGGWKYVNDDTGDFFDSNLTRSDVDEFLSKNRNPRDNFMQSYGFASSARKLADILSEYYPQAERYEMIYFDTHAHIMKQVM